MAEKIEKKEEVLCVDDANFAIACAFLEKFASLGAIEHPDFSELQDMLENTEVPPELIDFHIKLLRKARYNVHPDRWERSLAKFCYTYSTNDAWEVERFGYRLLRLPIRLRILKTLLESQFDANLKFKALVNGLNSNELRPQPLGRDKLGNAYWRTLDSNCNIRIYQENQDEESWRIVASNRDELAKLISVLSGNEPIMPNLQGLVDEDSSTNSEDARRIKEPPPQPQDDSNESESLPNENTEMELPKREEPKSEPVSKSEGHLNKFNRPSLLSPPSKLSDPTKNNPRITLLGKQNLAKINKFKLMDTTTGSKKSKYEDSEEEEDLGEEEQEDEEEDDEGESEEADESDNETGSIIQERVMYIRGEGSGKDCKSELMPTSSEEPEFSEVVEEEMCFVYGEGTGADCNVGNPSKSDSSSSSVPEPKKEQPQMFFFGRPGCLKLSPMKTTDPTKTEIVAKPKFSLVEYEDSNSSSLGEPSEGKDKKEEIKAQDGDDKGNTQPTQSAVTEKVLEETKVKEPALDSDLSNNNHTGSVNVPLVDIKPIDIPVANPDMDKTVAIERQEAILKETGPNEETLPEPQSSGKPHEKKKTLVAETLKVSEASSPKTADPKSLINILPAKIDEVKTKVVGAKDTEYQSKIPLKVKEDLQSTVKITEKESKMPPNLKEDLKSTVKAIDETSKHLNTSNASDKLKVLTVPTPAEPEQSKKIVKDKNYQESSDISQKLTDEKLESIKVKSALLDPIKKPFQEKPVTDTPSTLPKVVESLQTMEDIGSQPKTKSVAQIEEEIKSPKELNIKPSSSKTELLDTTSSTTESKEISQNKAILSEESKLPVKDAQSLPDTCSIKPRVPLSKVEAVSKSENLQTPSKISLPEKVEPNSPLTTISPDKSKFIKKGDIISQVSFLSQAVDKIESPSKSSVLKEEKIVSPTEVKLVKKSRWDQKIKTEDSSKTEIGKMEPAKIVKPLVSKPMFQKEEKVIIETAVKVVSEEIPESLEVKPKTQKETVNVKLEEPKVKPVSSNTSTEKITENPKIIPELKEPILNESSPVLLAKEGTKIVFPKEQKLVSEGSKDKYREKEVKGPLIPIVEEKVNTSERSQDKSREKVIKEPLIPFVEDEKVKDAELKVSKDNSRVKDIGRLIATKDDKVKIGDYHIKHVESSTVETLVSTSKDQLSQKDTTDINTSKQSTGSVQIPVASMVKSSIDRKFSEEIKGDLKSSKKTDQAKGVVISTSNLTKEELVKPTIVEAPKLEPKTKPIVTEKGNQLDETVTGSVVKLKEQANPGPSVEKVADIQSSLPIIKAKDKSTIEAKGNVSVGITDNKFKADFTSKAGVLEEKIPIDCNILKDSKLVSKESEKDLPQPHNLKAVFEVMNVSSRDKPISEINTKIASISEVKEVKLSSQKQSSKDKEKTSEIVKVVENVKVIAPAIELDNSLTSAVTQKNTEPLKGENVKDQQKICHKSKPQSIQQSKELSSSIENIPRVEDKINDQLMTIQKSAKEKSIQANQCRTSKDQSIQSNTNLPTIIENILKIGVAVNKPIDVDRLHGQPVKIPPTEFKTVPESKAKEESIQDNKGQTSEPVKSSMELPPITENTLKIGVALNKTVDLDRLQGQADKIAATELKIISETLKETPITGIHKDIQQKIDVPNKSSKGASLEEIEKEYKTKIDVSKKDTQQKIDATTKDLKTVPSEDVFSSLRGNTAIVSKASKPQKQDVYDDPISSPESIPDMPLSPAYSELSDEIAFEESTPATTKVENIQESLPLENQTPLKCITASEVKGQVKQASIVKEVKPEVVIKDTQKPLTVTKTPETVKKVGLQTSKLIEIKPTAVTKEVEPISSNSSHVPFSLRVLPLDTTPVKITEKPVLQDNETTISTSESTLQTSEPSSLESKFKELVSKPQDLKVPETASLKPKLKHMEPEPQESKVHDKKGLSKSVHYETESKPRELEIPAKKTVSKPAQSKNESKLQDLRVVPDKHSVSVKSDRSETEKLQTDLKVDKVGYTESHQVEKELVPQDLKVSDKDSLLESVHIEKITTDLKVSDKHLTHAKKEFKSRSQNFPDKPHVMELTHAETPKLSQELKTADKLPLSTSIQAEKEPILQDAKVSEKITKSNLILTDPVSKPQTRKASEKDVSKPPKFETQMKPQDMIVTPENDNKSVQNVPKVILIEKPQPQDIKLFEIESQQPIQEPIAKSTSKTPKEVSPTKEASKPCLPVELPIDDAKKTELSSPILEVKKKSPRKRSTTSKIVEVSETSIETFCLKSPSVATSLTEISSLKTSSEATELTKTSSLKPLLELAKTLKLKPSPTGLTTTLKVSPTKSTDLLNPDVSIKQTSEPISPIILQLPSKESPETTSPASKPSLADPEVPKTSPNKRGPKVVPVVERRKLTRKRKLSEEEPESTESTNKEKEVTEDSEAKRVKMQAKVVNVSARQKVEQQRKLLTETESEMEEVAKVEVKEQTPPKDKSPKIKFSKEVHEEIPTQILPKEESPVVKALEAEKVTQVRPGRRGRKPAAQPEVTKEPEVIKEAGEKPIEDVKPPVRSRNSSKEPEIKPDLATVKPVETPRPGRPRKIKEPEVIKEDIPKQEEVVKRSGRSRNASKEPDVKNEEVLKEEEVVKRVIRSRNASKEPEVIKEEVIQSQVQEQLSLATTVAKELEVHKKEQEKPNEEIKPVTPKKGRRGRPKMVREPVPVEEKVEEVVKSEIELEKMDIEEEVASFKIENPSKVDEESSKTSVKGETSTDQGETPTKGKRGKRKNMRMGLYIEEINAVEQEAADGPQVRQSRRIAQLKIREESERRQQEEDALLEMKENAQKKKHSPEPQQSEESASEEDKKGKKKQREKKLKKTKLTWHSGSNTSDSDEEDDEDDGFGRVEEDPGSPLFRSDHEFSPESDLEGDGSSVPTKMARTVRKGKDDSDEESDDNPDHACQKCSKHDHPEWILLCDTCDKGYHCSCLIPVLFIIPEGDWFCPTCQHVKLLEHLNAQLEEMDMMIKKKEREETRLRRLAFTNISQENVLPPEPVPEPRARAHSIKEKSSESSESGSNTDSDDVPIYKLRKRRQTAVSYRFNEYDALINSAIQHDMVDDTGFENLEPKPVIELKAGNLGRGKDISTIIEAENDKMEESDRSENESEERKSNQSDAENVELNEKKRPKPAVDDDSDSEPIRPSGKNRKMSKKKKHRKLNNLDLSSDDSGSDEDFKGSSPDSDDTNEEMSSGSESSMELELRRKKKRKDVFSARRSVRARFKRYDEDFINDNDDDSDKDVKKKPPPRKKKKDDSDFSDFDDDDDEDEEDEEDLDSEDLCDDSDSDSDNSDRPWGSKKKKKSSSAKKTSGKQPREPSGKGMKRPKKRFTDENEKSFKMVITKRKSDDEEDNKSNSERQPRRTRGKKINFLEDIESDDSDDGIKPGVKRPDTPPEEREQFIKKQEEIKRMLALKNNQAALHAATPKLEPLKLKISGLNSARAISDPDSLSTVPLQVIQSAKALDVDYMKNKEPEENSEFDDELPEDFNPEDMDEEEITKMMEEEDFAHQQLKLAGEVIRNKKLKEESLKAAAKESEDKPRKSIILETPSISLPSIPRPSSQPPSVLLSQPHVSRNISPSPSGIRPSIIQNLPNLPPHSVIQGINRPVMPPYLPPHLMQSNHFPQNQPRGPIMPQIIGLPNQIRIHQPTSVPHNVIVSPHQQSHHSIYPPPYSSPQGQPVPPMENPDKGTKTVPKKRGRKAKEDPVQALPATPKNQQGVPNAVVTAVEPMIQAPIKMAEAEDDSPSKKRGRRKKVTPLRDDLPTAPNNITGALKAEIVVNMPEVKPDMGQQLPSILSERLEAVGDATKLKPGLLPPQPSNPNMVNRLPQPPPHTLPSQFNTQGLPPRYFPPQSIGHMGLHHLQQRPQVPPHSDERMHFLPQSQRLPPSHMFRPQGGIYGGPYHQGQPPAHLQRPQLDPHSIRALHPQDYSNTYLPPQFGPYVSPHHPSQQHPAALTPSATIAREESNLKGPGMKPKVSNIVTLSTASAAPPGQGHMPSHHLAHYESLKQAAGSSPHHPPPTYANAENQETPGEFSGLVSYFSSQHDDLE